MHRNFFTAKIFPIFFRSSGYEPSVHRAHSVSTCPLDQTPPDSTGCTLSYSVCTASSKMTQPAGGSFWPLIPDLVKAPGVGGFLTIILQRGLLLTLLG